MAQNSYMQDGPFVYHPHNEIVQIIWRGVSGAQYANSKESPWPVVQSNQPTIQTLEDKYIYFDVISKRRYGVQGTQPVLLGESWVNVSTWYEEWLIQVGAFKQRDPENDTPQTWTSMDQLSVIQAVINGATISPWAQYVEDMDRWKHIEGNLFTQSWLQVIRSTDMRIIDFETDSGLKEKLPQFDFTLVVEQKVAIAVPSVTEIAVDSTPV